jgi:quinol monooxygenase YgiN
MNAPRRTRWWAAAGNACAGLVRAQRVAAAGSALYRNQWIDSGATRAHAAGRCCPVVELRQYTLHPQHFDRFVALFEREFIESQEAAGITVIGQFRDLDDPDRFVWLRGFPDMASRAQSLQAFYGGALWKSLRDEANANFVDTDNVLLLKPVSADATFRLAGCERVPIGSAARMPRRIVATIWPIDPADADAFTKWFAHAVKPVLADVGIALTAWFVTETAHNNFPKLPVREGERVLVWIATLAEARRDAALRDLQESKRWREAIGPQLRQRLKAAPQVLRLEPTARSLLR